MLDLCSLASGMVQHEVMKVVQGLKLTGKTGWSICVLTIVTHNDFDCAGEMNFLTKKAEEKRKEHLREGAEEKKTRKRRKEERRRSFFRNLSVALGSTSSVGRARSLYSFLVLISG